jgi:hypothetical protein
MQKYKLKYLTRLQFIFLIYLIITTTIYFISIRQGNNGIYLKLFGGGDDGGFYWNQALNVANGLPWIRTSIYPLIIGNLIKITGIQDVYIIRLFNFIGFVLLIIYSLKLIKLHVNDVEQRYKTYNIFLIIVLFYASLQMNVNLSIYRDIWIYFLFIFNTYLFIKIKISNNFRLLKLLLLIFSIYLLGEFRGYAMLSFLLSSLLFILYTNTKTQINIKTISLLAFIFFGIYYTFFLDFEILGMSLSESLNYRHTGIELYSGGSQMNIVLNQSNYLLFLLNYLYSYISNLLGPLPWQIVNFSTLLSFILETIPMFFILHFIWRNRLNIDEIQQYILFNAFVWIGFISFTNDNIGTATRLRTIGWILIINVFVALYSKSYKEKGVYKHEENLIYQNK